MVAPGRFAPVALLLVLLSGLAGAQAPPAEATRAAFLATLDRPRVDLDPKVKSTTVEGSHVVERLDFATERHADGSVERVPTLLVRPAAGSGSGRRPAVIVLHGTGGTKEAQRQWLDDLARRGMIALAIDARHHGERAGGEKGSAAYQAAITRAWKSGPGQPQAHPLYYDTVWDLWRTVDYLRSRPDVDPDRLGMIGFSMGGIQTWLAASVDERVAVAVPAIGVQSFKWGLEHDRYQARAKTVSTPHEAAARDLGESSVNRRVCETLWDKVIPGIRDRFDCPNMLALFGGRPLLILNGELDPSCPIEGAEVAFAAARAAHEAAGAGDRLKVDVAKGVGHAVTPAQATMALDWLATWLRATP